MKTIVLGFAAVLALSISAQAGIVFSDDFESDTLNAQPPVPWTVTAAEITSANVVDTGSVGTNQYVKLLDGDASNDVALRRDFAPTNAGTFQFDIRFNGGTNDYLNVDIRDAAGNPGVGLLFYPGGGGTVNLQIHSAAGNTEAGTFPTDSTWQTIAITFASSGVFPYGTYSVT